MQGNQVRNSVLAVGLVLAVLVGLSVSARSAMPIAQGDEPEGTVGQPAAAGGVSATPLGRAFTYQGRLEKDGRLVDGACNLHFELYDALEGGGQVGLGLTRSGVVLSDGLFTVDDLDFGAQFSGDARWLEVAVLCSGDLNYQVLSPRQALTAAPAALSLALPFSAESDYSGTLVSVTNSGTGDGLMVESAGGDGVHVASAGEAGLYVDQAYGDGVSVYWAAGKGVYVRAVGSPSDIRPYSSYKDAFWVGGAQGDGLAVGRADQDGVTVYSAGWYGVYVESAGRDGVHVDRAGNPVSLEYETSENNGVEIGAAEGDGVFVGRVDRRGLYVYEAGVDGVRVDKAGNPVAAPRDNALKNGFDVGAAEGDGLWVGNADRNGVHVESAGQDGVHVNRAGNPVAVGLITAANNGVEVVVAEGDGLFVGGADRNGLYVNSGGQDGVHVDKAGNPAADPTESDWNNGVEVGAAEGSGLYVGRPDVHGVYVYHAGDDGVRVYEAADIGVYAHTTSTTGNYGFYTPDDIYSGGTLASAGPLTIVAQNGDGAPLEPGDMVVISGAGAPFAGSDFPAPLVRRAGAGGAAVAGVVYARLVAEEEVEPVEQDGQEETLMSVHSHRVEGPVAPGEYLLLVVMGQAQVKASAVAGPIAPGDLLAAGGEGRAARVAGGYVPGSLLGTAMEALDLKQGSGLIWVLVNPR